MDVGERIRFYRKQKGLTQAQLADLSGIHPVSIRKYEVGMMRPGAEQICKISDTLGINAFLLHADQYSCLKLDSIENLEDSIQYLMDIGALTKQGGVIRLNPILEDFLVNKR